MTLSRLRVLSGIVILLSALVSARAAGAASPIQPIQVTGLVLTPDGGHGIAGARMELLPAWEGYAEGVRRLREGAEPAPLATARTNGEGYFELAAPEAGAYRVRVRAEGYVTEEHPLIPLVEDTALPPTLLQRAETVVVRVTSEADRPLSGVILRAQPEQREFPFLRTDTWHFADRVGVTGPGGTLTLTRAAGERLRLVAVSPADLGRSALLEPAGKAVRLAASRTSRLEVHGVDGKPAAEALVRWSSRPVGLTGPDGRLDLALPPGTSRSRSRGGTAAGPRWQPPSPSAWSRRGRSPAKSFKNGPGVERRGLDGGPRLLGPPVRTDAGRRLPAHPRPPGRGGGPGGGRRLPAHAGGNARRLRSPAEPLHRCLRWSWPPAWPAGCGGGRGGAPGRRSSDRDLLAPDGQAFALK